MKPNILEFSIGGYSGPGYGVKLADEKLIYSFYDEGLNYPKKQIALFPTGRKWANFKIKVGYHWRVGMA